MLTGGGGGGWHTGDDLMIACAIMFAFHFIALNHFCTPEARRAARAGGPPLPPLLRAAGLPGPPEAAPMHMPDPDL